MKVASQWEDADPAILTYVAGKERFPVSFERLHHTGL